VCGKRPVDRSAVTARGSETAVIGAALWHRGCMRRGLVVLSKLADDVLVGMPHSDNDPDEPAISAPLVVGDVLTWLLEMDSDESVDSDEPAEPSSPKAEEIVSLRVEQIRGATPKLLHRSTALPGSIGGRSLWFPFRLGRPRGRAEGLMVAVTVSGVDVYRVAPNCVLLTDST
jgi:hypothetical protein